MSLYVYVSYLEDGGMSFGFVLKNIARQVSETRHVRMTANKHSQGVPAYYDLRVDDGVVPTVKVIDQIVDEAFAQVPQPPCQQILTIPCKNGSLEMLVRDKYPQTAVEVKEVFRSCLHLAIKNGTVP